ncbi:MAG: CDP-alcohol phosphatidyltransferase family protein [Chloroflexota bacterium]|nr:CDP-alcohol phosphatidyltransferase family protein [Chloroflexota bacterium]
MSANQATWTGFALGLLACVSLGTGLTPFLKLGAWLYLLNALFDHVDGNIARYYGKTNHYGKFLDGSAGVIVASVLYLGIGMGVYRQCQNGHVCGFETLCVEPAYFLLAGGLASIARLANLYMQLRYRYAVVDAHQADASSERDEKGKDATTEDQDTVTAVQIHERTRLGRITWRAVQRAVGLAQWVFRVIQVPALILAAYTDTLAVYLLYCTMHALVIFVWEYARILHHGRKSLNVFRPY